MKFLYTSTNGSWNSSDPHTHTPGPYAARVTWDYAEDTLIRDVKADCLAILDTCFAGNIHKNALPTESRTYELLSASGPDRTTIGPGIKSFTSALIHSMEELREEHKGGPFTTWQLEQKIMMQETRRHNPPHLYPRILNYDRHIKLAPFKKTWQERQKKPVNQGPTTPSLPAYITLRVAINAKDLSANKIKKLATNVCKAARSAEVGVQRIDWLGMSSPPSSHRLRTFVNFYRAITRFKG